MTGRADERPCGSRLQSRFIALLLTLGATGGCTGSPEKPADKSALAPCGWFPNCVNSLSGQGLQAIDPIKANVAQWQYVRAWIVRQPNWEIMIDDSDFVQAVVKTPLMRFRDDVQLQFDPDSELIQVRSSSRLGISDLGTNRKRMEALRELLDQASANPQTSGANARSNLHD